MSEQFDIRQAFSPTPHDDVPDWVLSQSADDWALGIGAAILVLSIIWWVWRSVAPTPTAEQPSAPVAEHHEVISHNQSGGITAHTVNEGGDDGGREKS